MFFFLFFFLGYFLLFFVVASLLLLFFVVAFFLLLLFFVVFVVVVVFFRVREFQFLLGKICVAHSVAHSFIFLLCCALSVKVEIPPAGPRQYSKYRRSSSHKSPQ